MKAWAPRIQEHIDQWRERLGTRWWWPRYLYHFTDITNAASILKAGYLYSRSFSEGQRLMHSDNANQEIIMRTGVAKDCARLYFRPLTPTQYANEGIRPTADRGKAHCPVPVFFCFDAYQVLAADYSFFSDGNMASNRVRSGNDQEFFDSIPFNLVFHDGPMSPEKRDEVVFHRHAEVLVPGLLSLAQNLSLVVCRSAAERQTLLHLLPDAVRKQWTQRVRIAAGEMFNRKWTYVEDVVVSGDTITFRFNPSSRTPGPFSVKFTYRPSNQASQIGWAGVVNRLNDSWSLQYQGMWSGEAWLYLDNCLAFNDLVDSLEIPF